MSEGYYPSSLPAWRLRYTHERPLRLCDEAIDFGITRRDVDDQFIPCRRLRDYMPSPEPPKEQTNNWYLRTVRPISDECLAVIDAGGFQSDGMDMLVFNEIARATREIREAKHHYIEAEV